MTLPADFFAAHLRENAPRLFSLDSGASIDVTLRSQVTRSRALLYRYDVRIGSDVHHVLAKTHPQPTIRENAPAPRPQRFKANAAEKTEREAAALRLIETHFSSQDPARFGVIHVLDVLPEHQTILMLESPDTGLHPIIMSQSRLRSRSKPADLDRVLENAGAWLRHFDRLPPDASVDQRYDKREDFLLSVKTLTSFLSERTHDQRYFDRLAHQISEEAARTLPTTLPSARLHGDFAARNILVGPNGRVTLIDTLARWHVPIYEDIATFLTWFDINQLQLISGGMAFDPQWIKRCKQAFLRGYFEDEPIPQATIALFQIHHVLDKWTSLAAHFQRRRWTWRRLTDMTRNSLSVRRFKAVIQGLLQDIETGKG